MTNNQEKSNSSHLFPNPNFGRINKTLNIRPSIDIKNTNETEYDDKLETSTNIKQLPSLNKHIHLRDTCSLIPEEKGTNPQSPLHSVKTFKELKLDPQLLKGISDMGFQRPLRIQERVLPELLAYPPRNIIVQSQKGTGKTVTFLLSILNRIDPKLNNVQALILSPTLELALQIGKLIENMAKFLAHIKIAYAVRDPKISKRRQYIKGKELNVPIVIGTPGTVEDWCRKMKIIDLKKIRICVIDEADLMIYLPDFSQICIDLVKNRIGKDCQTMLFTDTYSNEVRDFAERIIENPGKFFYRPEEQSLSNIRQFYIECNNDEDKYDAVKTIYSSITIGQSMIFCRYKRSADALASRMKNDKHSVEVLSLELPVDERAAVINRFRDGKFHVLVATDVCARGIHIDDISLVLNFEFPLRYDDVKHCFIDEPDYNTYLHRIRLVGRSGRTDHTFNLIIPWEKHLLEQIENYFQKPIEKFSKQYPADTDVSNLPPSNLSSMNVSRFSFGNLKSENLPVTFNQPTANSQVRQSLETFPMTSSTQKQEILNDKSQSSLPLTSTNSRKQISATNEVASSTPNNTTILPDLLTSISEQSSLVNEEQEESDTLPSLGTDSLLSKKNNTILRDSEGFVLDRSDPNSPLYSITKFQKLNLKPNLLKGIFNMGFQSPSRIQSIALPLLLGNPSKNLIAQSQSGTGKTVVFSLSILSRINQSIKSPQALILVPTFELAIQIGSVIEKIAQFLPYIQIAYAVSDPTISKRINRVRGQLLPEPIVIGTPGTVEEWCRKLCVIDLSKLRICCIDEADFMIAIGGFQRTCVNILYRLNRSNCQMMLFSATYSNETMAFARKIVPNPHILRLRREKQILTNIRQFFIRCYDQEQKYYAIEEIYACLTVGQAMIFCQTKLTALDLAMKMQLQKHSVREIMSILDTEQREEVIKQFREGVFRVLISTNIAARGLDVDDITLIINYDMPVIVNSQPDYETYLHRIGRCGRFGKLGYTFNLIDSDEDFKIMKSIEKYFNHHIHETTIEKISQLEEIE